MTGTRAVSDVVAYTLVFTTIIFMIGTITVGGIDTFTDVRQATETNTAEDTMRAYAKTLADHRNEGVPRRGSTIKLQGHSLNRVDSSLGIEIENGGSPVFPDEDIETGAFVRTTETDTELVYESGALFRIEDDGAVVVRQPPLRCDSGTARLPLTRVNSDATFDSTTRVTLRSELVDQRLRYPDTSGSGTTRARADTVTIDTSSSEYTDAWNMALEEMGWSSTGSGDEYECGSLDRAVVHVTEIDISLVS